MDPLSQVVALLQPGAAYSKLVTGSGRWQVRQPHAGHAFFCAVLEGHCEMTFDGQPPIALRQGDFILMPANPGFTVSTHSDDQAPLHTAQVTTLAPGVVHFGDRQQTPDLRMMGGVFAFGSPDASLLLSLLPTLLHLQGEPRLARLAALLNEESRADKPARDAVMNHLLEVMLIEALRSEHNGATTPGLARGLADPRLAAAIRIMHDRPAHGWTVAALAKESALSRTSFFERFSNALGVPPMEYLLSWRMALAKDLLRRQQQNLSEIALYVGYSSASTFSTAFTRHVGLPPSHYAQQLRERL
ncbi:AraC family transcriptional regulator [Izhakiella australiensis]|uniref:AraC family transcriptional regulator n=1 Tax=Izhakiella australiensis TaxID=1926881 RepID=A0A1S8YRE8_9GAMM|nr:AraC family transcriptional regulator [Izhakiella australiensis]OON41392.1 AraC family transcriptional regulator [Izhakiella australiensis]